MSEEQQYLDVEAIVEKAFGYFNKFIERGEPLKAVLLEELQPQDDGWIVAIGFNGSREESSQPATAGAMAALAGFGNKTTTTVREVRHIYIENDGSFQKIV